VLDQVGQVGGVHLAGVAGDRGRERVQADDAHAVVGDDLLARDGALDVAAGGGGEVDDDRAGLHAGDGGGAEQARRGAPEDLGGGDDDVALRDDLGHLHALPLELLVGERLGVALLGLALLAAEVELDEARAERLDLLGHDGARVVGVDPAPRRLAVAIACRPATPTPRTNARAGAMVPAGVDIIGSTLSMRWAASTTAT
jgi:hypothetical protein